jgi:hypothetical protein
MNSQRSSDPNTANASSGSVGAISLSGIADMHTTMAVRDFATRLFLLGQFVAHLESDGESNFPLSQRESLPAELLERLRRMTLADSVRFAGGSLGISISVDCRELLQHLARAERVSDDRQRYEAFVRRGASVRLLCRLFGVTEIEVRRLRKLVAPEATTGGRPRRPADERCREVASSWRDLQQQRELSERDRWCQLSDAFDDLPIVSLEAIVAEVH